MHALPAQVHGRFIEAQENVRSLHVEIADLINLVRDLERASKEGDQRAGRVNDADLHLLMPRVAIEIAANEVAILQPHVERVRRRMDAEEPAAGANIGEKRLLL